MITSIRFRAADDGKMILQVCDYTEPDRSCYGSSAKSEWRDAIVEDLINVAAYVRAHDSLTNQINTLQDSVIQLRGAVDIVMEERAAGRDVRGG